MIDFLGRVFSPLTAFMSSVLETFHSLGAPWWLSVMFLTILVRGVLFPLTVRQVKNMRAMQDLRPEMDGLRERYKDDRQKQQEAIMELYRERKINPAAGFFPILIQMPVFITMYHVIRNHEETFPSFATGGFLWFSDLTKADPYFILPILSATILIGAGEISSRNVNPNQRMMMRFLPVVFTFFIARFPAGLFVYWVTSNTVTLVQNYLIYHHGPGRTPPPEPAQSPSRDTRERPQHTREAAAKSSGVSGGKTGPAVRKSPKRRKKKKKRR
ncbi:MAG: membrane protein insertase YidC [Rubrobacteraceae bacterium]